jgi:hypothetical protein
MLNSKRSRRKSSQFDSRFRDGRGGEFPLRQYLRCKEDFVSGIVHLGLLVVFIVTLYFFGRTVDQLFRSHGEDLSPWFHRVAVAAMAIFILSVVRRLYYKVLELREIRRDIRFLKTEIDEQEE